MMILKKHVLAWCVIASVTSGELRNVRESPILPDYIHQGSNMLICCLFYLYAAAGCSTGEVPMVPATSGHLVDPVFPSQNWKSGSSNPNSHKISQTLHAAAEFLWTEVLQHPKSVAYEELHYMPLRISETCRCRVFPTSDCLYQVLLRCYFNCA